MTARPWCHHNDENFMKQRSESVAKRIFRDEWEHLSPHEREVIEGVLHRISIPRNPNTEFADHRTFGERASDTIAKLGGSWTFILLFLAWLVFWAVLNTEILGPLDKAFDPYPYIFLNLVLSMIAAIQAPILMMSQNREAKRDRLEAEIDHEVNVRAELAIHQMDARLHVIERQLLELVASAERQTSPTATQNSERPCS